MAKQGQTNRLRFWVITAVAATGVLLGSAGIASAVTEDARAAAAPTASACPVER